MFQLCLLFHPHISQFANSWVNELCKLPLDLTQMHYSLSSFHSFVFTLTFSKCSSSIIHQAHVYSSSQLCSDVATFANHANSSFTEKCLLACVCVCLLIAGANVSKCARTQCARNITFKKFIGLTVVNKMI